MQKLACLIEEDGLVFDLSNIASDTYYNKDSLYFNLCSFVQLPSSSNTTYQTFAYNFDGNGDIEVLTNNQISPKVTLHKKEQSPN